MALERRGRTRVEIFPVASAELFARLLVLMVGPDLAKRELAVARVSARRSKKSRENVAAANAPDRANRMAEGSMPLAPDTELTDRARALSGLLDRLGLGWDQLEPFGWYSAKLDLGALDAILRRPRGRYVNVSSTNPTPLGEGKTITAIGLGMALWRAGRRASVTLRQPSLAPIFGIKGGGAGGGRAALTPADRINLNLTGDLHAIAAAHNLLEALLENHLGRGLAPQIDPAAVSWSRVLDVGDRALRRIRTGVGQRWVLERETGFELTAASETMAIVSLATSVEDLRRRLANVVVLPVRGARLAAGAGYVYVLAGDVVRLPGLPAVPAALRLDVDPLGRVTGLT